MQNLSNSIWKGLLYCYNQQQSFLDCNIWAIVPINTSHKTPDNSFYFLLPFNFVSHFMAQGSVQSYPIHFEKICILSKIQPKWLKYFDKNPNYKTENSLLSILEAMKALAGLLADLVFVKLQESIKPTVRHSTEHLWAGSHEGLSYVWHRVYRQIVDISRTLLFGSSGPNLMWEGTIRSASIRQHSH